MINPLGLHASFARTLPLPERLSILRDAGFDSTALWWEEQREEIRAIRHLAPDMVVNAGLALDHLHVPYFACNELWSASPLERDAALALHEGWVLDCRRHAIPRMVMHATRGRTPPPPSPSALDSFRRLVACAEDARVELALENTHAVEPLHHILSSISSPVLSLCYDVAHDRLHSPSPLALLHSWNQRVSVLHVSDTDGRRDWHWLPGDGNTDFAEVGGCFDPPFRGPLMLEGMHRGDSEDVASFARRAFESAKAVRDCIFPVSARRPTPISTP